MSNVEPGDRYVTHTPCGPACTYRSIPPEGFLATHPYAFTFRAPAKGRWLDRPLLSVCVDEFAYAPPPSASADSSTTLDHRVTLPAYVEELADGSLWLQRREAECRAAGQAYRRRLVELWAAAVPAELSCETAHVDGGADTAWASAKRWLNHLPSSASADAILHGQLPCLLPLRQRDVVLHHVWRMEGRMFAGQPLEILRCDLAQRERNREALAHASARATRPTLPPALLVVRKPSGLPAHPSGRYRKNTCTSILEDVMGGCDTSDYRIHEEVPGTASDGGGARAGSHRTASLVHVRHGFTLLTVRICTRVGDGSGANSEEAGGGDSRGLSEEDWALLKQIRQAGERKLPEEAGSPGNGDTVSGPSPALAPLKAYVVHRLDAATSGVLLFGLDAPTAQQTAALVAQKDGASGTSVGSAKTYLAQVRGWFELTGHGHHCQLVDELAEDTATTSGGPPASPVTMSWLRVDRPIGCLSFHKSLYWSPNEARTEAWRAEAAAAAAATVLSATAAAAVHGVVSGVVAGAGASRDVAAVREKNERMRALTRGPAKRPRACAEAEGGEGGSLAGAEADFTASLRAATTLLRPLHYAADRDETVVLCQLRTGRTHQLRVHLASLGHPIVGDGKYIALCDRLASSRWGVSLGSGAETAPDDVARYYTTGGNLLIRDTDSMMGSGAEADAEAEDGGACACPERIQLHAWCYALYYNPTGSSESGAAAHSVRLVAEPYDAAMRDATAGLLL